MSWFSNLISCTPLMTLCSANGVGKKKEPVSFAALLGENVHTKGGLISTTLATTNKKGVLLYFSASWCGPCKQFTPVLMQFYKENKDKEGQQFEIVFVSQDHSEEEFLKYYKDMPWAAIPYEERDRAAALGRKFRVAGIPMLVVLDEEGRLCTPKGRDFVHRDPKAAQFPWRPKTLHDLLKGAKGVTSAGTEYELSGAIKGKITALYIGALWAAPCQKLTPVLVEAYKKLERDRKPFEIIFVSNDRTEKDFQKYFEGMPWLAIPFTEDSLRDKICTNYEVREVPTLVVFDENGTLLLSDAAELVMNDPECKKYPWKPDVVDDMEGPRAAAAVARDPMCVVIAPRELVEIARAAMMPVAKEYARQAEKNGEDEPKAKFFVGSEGKAVQLVRQVTGIQDPLAILFLNLPSVYKAESKQLTERNIESFVADALASKLPARPIRKSALADLLKESS
eukprot:tig00020684_g12869.t1